MPSTPDPLGTIVEPSARGSERPAIGRAVVPSPAHPLDTIARRFVGGSDPLGALGARSGARVGGVFGRRCAPAGRVGGVLAVGERTSGTSDPSATVDERIVDASNPSGTIGERPLDASDPIGTIGERLLDASDPAGTVGERPGSRARPGSWLCSAATTSSGWA